MSKQLSTITILVVTFSLLFVSVVYACSGLDSMQLAFHDSSMDGEKVERGPCSDHKQDICKSVRNRMITVQVSSSKAEISLVSLALQSSVTAEMFALPDIGSVSLLSRAFPNSISNISPFLSHVILRI